LENPLSKSEHYSVDRLLGFHSFVELSVSDSPDSTIIHLALDSPFRFEQPFKSEEIGSKRDGQTNSEQKAGDRIKRQDHKGLLYLETFEKFLTLDCLRFCHREYQYFSIMAIN